MGENSGSSASSSFSKLRQLFSNRLTDELISMLKIAIPIGITSLLHFSIMTESVIMCGHLSGSALEAVSLANSMMNAFGLGINIGVITACDTLFSQCSGSVDKKRTGMFLQRSNSLMICWIHPLLLGILYLFIEPIFIGLGQNPEVSAKAAEFLQFSIPGVLFNSEYYVLVRYMQSQNHVYPPFVIALLGNIFNVVSQYVFIFVLGFDYQASAVCQSLTYFFQFLSALFYIIVSKFYIPTWDGWKAEALFDWKSFASLALAGVGHVCLETICYEGCTFLAGIMGVVQLGAQSILFQTQAVIFMIPVSLGIAVNIRVGQSLGANKPSSARMAIKVGVFIGAVSAFGFGSLVLILKDVIPKLFTTDEAVLSLAMGAFPVIAFVVVMNHFLAILNGVLRGCGKQKTGAYIVVVCYSIIGFPIAILMTFTSDIGILGLWLGIIIGLIFCFILLTIAICQLSMEEQAERAQERIRMKYRRVNYTEDVEENNDSATDEEFINSTRQIIFYSGVHDRWIDQSLGVNISRQDISRAVCQKGCLTLLVIGAFVLAVIFHSCFPFPSYDPPSNSTLNNITDTPEFYSTTALLY